jgi:outer membrane protein OmpA-like peptidoglycan-associated protein
MRRPAIAVVAAALLAAGCAAPGPQANPSRDAVIILPGKDGKVGGVVVRQAGQEHLLDSAWNGVEVPPAGAMKARAFTPTEVHDIFADTVSALPPRPATFLLYFLEGKDEFTAESRAEIQRIVEELKRRPAPDIMVIGHTDTVGNDANNDRLSLQRAERVRELLVKPLGLSLDRIQAAGRGERELLVSTPDGVSEPRNRRVEINVR